jgi:tetratricopeptide (TPR) repeat protein
MKLIKYWPILAVIPLLYAGFTHASVSELWSESYRYETIGDYATAAQSIEPLIRHNPEHEFAVIRHGWLNYLQGQYNESINDYKKAIKINQNSLDSLLGMTLPLLAQKRWREAANYATKVLATAPWNYFAHIRLMICEEGQGQWKTLELHADSVASRYPADATVLVYLARARSRQGKVSSARETYKKVLVRVPGHIEATQYLNNLNR